MKGLWWRKAECASAWVLQPCKGARLVHRQLWASQLPESCLPAACTTHHGSPRPGRAFQQPHKIRAAPQSPSASSSMNKVPVAMGMDSTLYEYMLVHTREAEVLAQLREETHELQGRHMQITPEQGQLLALLVELMGARRAIEVGVFTGYSALAVALALPDDGRLVALDKDARSMAVAKKYFQAAGVSHKVRDMLGPALESLQSILQEEGPSTYDFAFIDADKRVYQQYFEILLQLVRPGGLIVVDNVLFYGKVARPSVEDKATVALRAFNAQVLKDERVSLSIIPVGDGVALCRKR